MKLSLRVHRGVKYNNNNNQIVQDYEFSFCIIWITSVSFCCNNLKYSLHLFGAMGFLCLQQQRLLMLLLEAKKAWPGHTCFVVHSFAKYETSEAMLGFTQIYNFND